MRCPNCGTENLEGDKFCVECGTALDVVEKVEESGPEPEAEPATETDLVADEPEPAADEPEPEAEPAADEAKPEDKGATSLSGRLSGMDKRQKTVAAGIAAAVVAVVVAVLVAMNMGPSDGIVEDYLRSQSFASTTVSGESNRLSIDSVKVTSKEKKTIESGEKQLASLMGIKGDVYYEYQAEVSASGNGVQMTATYNSISVAKTDGGDWEVISGYASDKTYSTSAGMGTSAVQDEVSKGLSVGSSSILSMATTTKTPLLTLYEDGTATVTDEQFDADAQTDTFTIELSKETPFSTRKATVTATYRFVSATGSWNLSDASADPDAGKTSYQKMVGTWTGSFTEQKGTTVKCLGASAQPIRLTIDSIDDKTMEVKGTVSALAHYHERGEDSVSSTDGDQYLESQPFTMVLTDNAGWWSLSPDGDYEGRYQFPESEQGKLYLYLAFGSYNNPSSAKASFVTETSYKQGYFNQTTDYGDFFTLSKEG